MKGEKSSYGVNLDPEYSDALHWAWASAKQWRAKWWLGGVLFGAAGIVTGFIIPGSWGNKLELSLIAFSMAVVAVILISLALAFLIAPYQQRNALRDRIDRESPAEARKFRNQSESRTSNISQLAQAGSGSDIVQAGRDVRHTSPQTKHREQGSND